MALVVAQSKGAFPSWTQAWGQGDSAGMAQHYGCDIMSPGLPLHEEGPLKWSLPRQLPDLRLQGGLWQCLWALFPESSVVPPFFCPT